MSSESSIRACVFCVLGTYLQGEKLEMGFLDQKINIYVIELDTAKLPSVKLVKFYIPTSDV